MSTQNNPGLIYAPYIIATTTEIVESKIVSQKFKFLKRKKRIESFINDIPYIKPNIEEIPEYDNFIPKKVISSRYTTCKIDKSLYSQFLIVQKDK